MSGRVIFVGVDPEAGLDADVEAAVKGADEIVATKTISRLFSGFVMHTGTATFIEPLVDRAGMGKVVVRAVEAKPLFDDETLAAIAELSEAPVELHVVPPAAVRALPLYGKRVLVTRAKVQAQETIRAFRRRGARPVFLPTIDIGEPDDASALEAAVRTLGSYDLVAFTSANGVSSFFDVLRRARLDARAFGAAKIASIGPGTRNALESRGIRADLEPEEHRGEGLARAILAMTTVKRVLLPRAAVAREVLPEMLRAAGVHVDVVEAYRTRKPSESELVVGRQRVTDLPPDAITFTSSSTVENFVESFPDARLEKTVVASIGPITTETCKRLGVRVDVEANPYTIPALIEALERVFSGR